MALSMCYGNTVQAATEHKMFELSAPEKVKQGDTVSVVLKVFPKLDLTNFEVIIKYDENAFQYSSSKRGENYLNLADSEYGVGSTLINAKYASNMIKMGYIGYQPMVQNENEDIFYTLNFIALKDSSVGGNTNFQLIIDKVSNLSSNIELDKDKEHLDAPTFLEIPLTGIKLNESTLNLTKGSSVILDVEKVPSYSTEDLTGLKWISENEKVATVDNTGKVTAVGGGVTNVKVTKGNLSATCKVTVSVPLDSISIESLDKAIDVGSSKTLKVTYNPEDTTADRTVVWTTSDSSIVKVDANGIVTGIKKGTALITATASNGKTATVEVKVRQPLLNITIDSSDFELIKNTDKTLTVIENPNDHDDKENISSKTWMSEDSTIASVDENGKVTAHKEGTTLIHANYVVNGKEVRASVKVTVKEIHVESVTLSQEKLSLEKGDSEKLETKVNPTNTTDDITQQIWKSSNENVVTVDKTGKITAVGGGTAKITVTIAGKSASCDVAVHVPLEKIEINNAPSILNVKDTHTLIVTYIPTDTTVERTVNWTSSNTNVATVDENGKVIAIGKGEVIITAEVGNQKATATIMVRQPLESIEINQQNVTLIKGESINLTVKENPALHDDHDNIASIVWSSDLNVVSYDQTGFVKASKEGKALVTVTYKVGDKELTATTTITVVEYHITDVELDKSTLELNKGDKATLTATYKPENTTDNTTKIWTSSDDKVLTVDKEGNITAVGGGKATVTVEIAGVKATCEVTVHVPLQSISITPINKEIDAGNQKQLEVIYTPTDTTVDKKVKWESSDTSIVTVDENGIISCMKKGTATITATVDGKSATVEVKVRQPLLNITIDSSDFELIKNTNKVLTVTENPSEHDDSNNIKSKTWQSDNPTIASVDENGKVTAHKEGTTLIHAIYDVNGKKVETSVKVTVKEIHITEVKLDKETLSLIKGDETTIKATYSPLNTTDDTEVTYKSSDDKVVTVDKDGNVVAVGGGKATITATIAGVNATCEVTVRVPLTGIKLESETSTLLKGQEVQLTIAKLPTDATDVLKNIEYTVDDESIATVSANGIVKGKKDGTVVVTVKGYVDNQEFAAEMTLTVKEIKLESIEITMDDPKVVIGSETQLEVKYNPSNTTDDRTVEWKVSDDTIATIDENGKLTALKPGTVVVTVISKFDDTINFELEIEVYEIPMESVEFDEENIEMEIGDKYQCTVNVLPENTTDSKELVWESSDSSVVKVDGNGKLTAIKAGTAVITVSSKDGKFKDTLTVKVNEEKPTVKPGGNEGNENNVNNNNSNNTNNKGDSVNTSDNTTFMTEIVGMIASLGVILVCLKKKEEME